MTPNPPGRPHFSDVRDHRSPRIWRQDAATTGDAWEGPPPFLSVVVPAKDEAESLPRLVAEIAAALRPLCDGREPRASRLGGFEILIVDDGSTDATPRVLRILEVEHPELRPIRLRANVGQSGATAAGIRAARGSWIATLDADLQNDPADLETLWRELPGHDAALGWRVERRDRWIRRVVSRWANRVRNAVLGQAILDTGCSVRIFRRDLALRLPLFQGVHRFLGPLLIREGARVVQVPVNHRARPHGTSHYNFRNRSFRVLVDLLGVSWLMSRPLRYEAYEPRGVDPDLAPGEAADSRRARDLAA
ncbi:glycosyltransferase family 2 protein [Paludisphaera mucosa]|uniref:Glycosyltransferase family 2 protein n=1 Tax=Paludisphaera mucosa TaxID=3030827 RepID=A0ABT6FBV3_9BACT|nr:glycosyltransferase family 2 protein [Paludisphaera mucosa]